MTDRLEPYFELPLALRLAEHADSCDEHARSFSEDDTATTCPGGLVWVKDWGTYRL